MSSGFKADQVGISSIVITGSTAQVEVQFVDSRTAQVHAVTKHSIPLSGEAADQAVKENAQGFLQALQEHITKLHYEDPDVGSPIQETARGISESLRGEADEPG